VPAYRVTGKIMINGSVQVIDDIISGKNVAEATKELNKRVADAKDKKLFPKRPGSYRSVGKPYDLKFVEDKNYG
jgi:hypothetical protein